MSTHPEPNQVTVSQLSGMLIAMHQELVESFGTLVSSHQKLTDEYIAIRQGSQHSIEAIQHALSGGATQPQEVSEAPEPSEHDAEMMNNVVAIRPEIENPSPEQDTVEKAKARMKEISNRKKNQDAFGDGTQN